MSPEEEKIKKDELRRGLRKKRLVLTCGQSSTPIQCRDYPALCPLCGWFKEYTFYVKVNYVRPNIHVQFGLF